MPTLELTEDEFATLRYAFDDVGCDCPSVDWDKFKTLGVKFGFWEAEKPPTEEELKRRQELINSPYGKQMRELFAQTKVYIEHQATILTKDIEFVQNVKWPNELITKSPNCYNIILKHVKMVLTKLLNELKVLKLKWFCKCVLSKLFLMNNTRLFVM